jgi:hypothetical protein
MIFHRAGKRGTRGWYIRRYHSPYAMKAHLRHLTKGSPPPRHWRKPKDWDWRLGSYMEEGPYTKREAMEGALT